MEPGFLVASPQLRDPHFQRTVVLLLRHDAEGAMGVVVNREAPLRLSEVLDHVDGLTPARANRLLLWGGPVDSSMGFVIFRGRASEGWQVRSDLSVSASRDRLSALIADGAEFHLCMGYAGWGPGQLDREVAEGSWIHVDAAPALLFGTSAPDRYDLALAQLGIAADSLWMTPVDE